MNLQSIVVERNVNHGDNYKLLTDVESFTDPQLAVKLQAADFFFMPDIEQTSVFNPNSDAHFPASARAVMKDLVHRGGVLVQTGTSGGADKDFLKRIFSWDLS